MSFVVFKDGKVLLDENGLAKLADSDPPAVECCCEPATCCEDFEPLPDELTATITSADICACIAQVFTLTKDYVAPADPSYLGAFIECNAPFNPQAVEIRCEYIDGVANWIWDMGSNCRCGAPVTYTGTLLSCSPLHIEWTGIALCSGCCGANGTIDVEVTE